MVSMRLTAIRLGGRGAERGGCLLGQAKGREGQTEEGDESRGLHGWYARMRV